MRVVKIGVCIIGLIFLFSSLAFAVGMATYQGENFTMKIPSKMQVQKNYNYGMGWTGPRMERSPLQIFVMGQLKSFPPQPDMESFLVTQTGIASNKWQLADQGQSSQGWKWFKVYQAVWSGKTVVAVIGHSNSGAFIMTLGTTTEDFSKNQQMYSDWFNSIEVK